MTPVTARIRRARVARGWDQERLAEEMTTMRAKVLAQNGEPADDFQFSVQQTRRLEAGRPAVALNNPDEPLWWALKVLGIDKAAVLEGCP